MQDSILTKTFGKNFLLINIPSKGGVLIEFAITLPILIAIIYFVVDAPKYKREYSKIGTCANYFVSIIQNVSQKRSDKRIKKKDLNFARYASALCAYPGKTAYTISGSGHSQTLTYGHYLLMYVHYIRGTGKNKCKIIWRWDSYYAYPTPEDQSRCQTSFTVSDGSHCVINIHAGEVDSNEIYNGFEIENGEIKLIVDTSYYCYGGIFRLDGKKNSEIPIGKRFGLAFITPKKTKDGASETYFHTVTIFTPKPGLFNDTPPQ